MQKPGRKLEWVVWGILGSVILGITFVYFLQRVDSRHLKVIRRLPDFTLTNQLNQPVSLSSLRGEVCLANIIFTRCPGPCATMTRQFAELQKSLAAKGSVRLVSLTADPEHDSPEVLKNYAAKFGADFASWHFLTGPKKEVYGLALDGLMLALQEKSEQERASEDDLFIHSTLFVLVDKRGNVRAFYESTESEVNERILSDVRQLLKER